MTDRVFRLAVAGAAGRMGHALINTIAGEPGVRLVIALEHPQHSALGGDAGVLAGVGRLGVPVVGGLSETPTDYDVLIDFTPPQAVVGHVRACRTTGRRMVIGTTGLDEEQRRQISDASTDIGIVLAPNMSIGVNLCLNLVTTAARALGEHFDVEIIEAHHRHKVDAPSGTALRLGEQVAAGLNRDLGQCAVYARYGDTGERDRRTIGFSTIRAGDIVGDHTVLFAGLGERIEITHRAMSRATFASGAVRAARWLMDKPPGLYDMQNVLGFA